MVDSPKELSCLPVLEDRCLENMACCVDEAISIPVLLDSHGILFFHVILLQGFKFKISNRSLLMDAVVPRHARHSILVIFEIMFFIFLFQPDPILVP